MADIFLGGGLIVPRPAPRMDSMIWLSESTPDIRHMMLRHETSDPETGEIARNWVMKDGLVGFPRAAEDILRGFPVLVDARADGHPVDLASVDYSKHPEPGMGEKCVAAVKETLSQIHTSVHGGRVLVAPCGAGKTVMGAGMISDLGRSALVLVHKDFLVGQWEETFMDFLGLRADQIGYLREDQMDFGPEFPVVIGMIQTVLSRAESWPPELFNSFGTLVGDEVHRAGAAKWRMAAPMFPGRYRIGLTATEKRGDGNSKIFLNHFGPVSARIEREVHARYEVIPTDWNPSPSLRAKMASGGQGGGFNLRWAQSLVAQNKRRNEQIALHLAGALDAGRKVILLSDRLKQLEWFQDWALHNHPQSKTVKVVGGMKAKKVKEVTKGAKLILATYGMAAEGLDVADLDTLFLASPRGKGILEQATGRLLRGDYRTQNEFLALDYVDVTVPAFARMGSSRAAEARRMGWTVR